MVFKAGHELCRQRLKEHIRNREAEFNLNVNGLFLLPE